MSYLIQPIDNQTIINFNQIARKITIQKYFTFLYFLLDKHACRYSTTSIFAIVKWMQFPTTDMLSLFQKLDIGQLY